MLSRDHRQFQSSRLKTPIFWFADADLLVHKRHAPGGHDYKNSAMTVNAAGRVADWRERNILLEVRGFALIAALCAALLAHVAQADEAAPPEPNARPSARWRGQICTPAGCTTAPAKPWSIVIGFGVAALAAGWIGRRISGSP
jgi:hypothetical protein